MTSRGQIPATFTNFPPKANDPRLVEMVKAMARQQARKDHEAEMQRIAEKHEKAA